MSDWNWGLAITLIAIIAGYFVSPFISHKLTVRRDKLRAGKQVIKEVKQLGERAGQVETKLGLLAQAVVALQNIVKSIARHIIYPEIEETKSPVQLTKLGHQLARESGIEQHITDNLKYHKQQINMKGAEFEIFKQCESIADAVFQTDSSRVKKIKQYFYETGRPDVVMSRIYTLKLRDTFLQLLQNKSND